MKCILPGQNAMVFARAIQAFARIGTELYIEGQPDGLSIRTVNRNKSAFALMLFQTDFFISYDLETSSDTLVASQQTGETSSTPPPNVVDHEFDNKCKISIKACLTAFKNMKQVEQCKISLDSINFKLIIELKCLLDTVKTHVVSILEQEALQAVYTTQNVPNSLTGSYKLFDDIVSNFQSNEEELTIEVSGDKIIVKNYVEGSHVDTRYMRSQLSLRSDEFESYSITKPTSITFSLRELRAMLGFADALNIDISINFEITGQPVVFILKNTELFEANLVMSTLSPEFSTNECNDGGETMDTESETTINTVDTVPRPLTSVNQNKSSVITEKSPVVVENCLVDLTILSPLKKNDKPTHRPSKTTDVSSPSVVFNFNKKNLGKSKKKKSSRILSDDEEFDNPSVSTINTMINQPNTASTELTNNTAAAAAVAANNGKLDSEDVQVLFCDESESLLADLPMDDNVYAENMTSGDLVDSVPPSPPSKIRRLRTRKMFRRCFESTFDPKNLPGTTRIFAPASDTEDN